MGPEASAGGTAAGHKDVGAQCGETLRARIDAKRRARPLSRALLEAMSYRPDLPPKAPAHMPQ